MKKLKFKPEIVGVPFNTNNAWGFGGGVGTSYKFPNGLEYRTGTAYFRHLKSERFGHFRDATGRTPYAESLAAIGEYLA